MLSAEDNDLLCRAEGDAPTEQIMRRHRLPACLSEEVADRDGAPLGGRPLGEDPVAFRDSDGRRGVTPEERAACPVGRAAA
jgi:phthalate 4,5-dioxygenase oxygenase subunit